MLNREREIALYELMKTGDRNAANDLAQLLFPIAYNVARKWANKYLKYDRDEIIRVAGLAIAITLKRADPYKDNFSAYLTRVVISVSSDHWRKHELVPVGAKQYLKGRPNARKRTNYLPINFDPLYDDHPSRIFEIEDTKRHEIRAIHLALEAISKENEKAAKALAARYLEEKTTTTIGKELGIHNGNVSKILIKWFPKFAEKVRDFIGENDIEINKNVLQVRNTEK